MPEAAPGWAARLDLDYRLEGGRTVARFSHEGPLRVLKSLYPEGAASCHTVLVHPPAGLVGGDSLAISLDLAPGAHALVTTPAAGRFYRSAGPEAAQQVVVRQAAGSRLEWLPLETIAHSGCHARIGMTMHLTADAELMAWDVLALGLPASGQPFESGSVLSHWELAGQWQERGRIGAQDRRLLDGPLGLAGRRCQGLLVFAAGAPLAAERRAAALEAARDAIATPLGGTQPLDACMAGATAPGPQVVVVRALGAGTADVMPVLRAVHARWRARLWDLPAVQLRGWAL